ncbi:MAG: sle [Solirubrobacterales bacterium]|nr:sle [Solirubrobacterales bacterium]
MPDQATSKTLYDLYAAALDAMKSGGPSALGRRVKFEAEERDTDALAQPSALVEHIAAATVGDRLLTKLRLTLATWDADTLGGWADGAAPRTVDRRARIYELLKLDEDLIAAFDAAMPVATDDAVVVSREFKPWYGRVMAERDPFYWQHYGDYLASRGFDENSIAALDLNTTRIVERLSDPEREEAYQAKGLVVGYVQSGKTANFTGVAAKAVDAGYRLIIVLTGTTDLLRGQTQRRLDKELVGFENLMRGVDDDDEEALLTVDYASDPDWDAFVRHGALPSTLGVSDVYRLTTHAGDYKSLKQGISSLDFDRFDPAQPLNAAANLHRVPTRIAIVKKNKSVLKKLVADLKRITAKLADIPALIIDDESDQASINTSNPQKWEQGRTERTAINELISQLLHLLPRGQYVGYTATPFANVFVDPSDAVDIFPRDFILALDRAPGYMGARDFHDLDRMPEDDVPTVATSNELAFIRPVGDEDAEAALQEALDQFVLTGAIKLYREQVDGQAGRFKHHTMLVHESVKQADHRDLADAIRDLWRTAGYYGAGGLRRLEELFDRDVLPVMEVRSEGEPVPASFSDVKPFVGEVVTRIEGSANDPALIVNGDKDAAREDVDFERRAVWRILVGGTKLSRGFTVEGLTVSYYRRVTKQADTLMQMGRWFGFRAGYKDLVRLYIGRGAPGTSGTALDLYHAFEAACRSEELFRAELERYAKVEDGVPAITPAQVPPLVAQHLGWLKPAASNKMYNARLVERRSPGERLEPVGYPKTADAIKKNTETLLPLIRRASSDGTFAYRTATGERSYPASYGTIDHAAFVAMLKKLGWEPEDHFAADLTWLDGLDATQIEDWAVILPQHAGKGPRATIAGHGPLSVFRRRRRRDPLFGAISDPKHRFAADRIAGVGDLEDPLADTLHQERRGAVLVYPVVEHEQDDQVHGELDAEEVVIALVFVAPESTGSPDGTLVRFVVRDSAQRDEPIVDA